MYKQMIEKMPVAQQVTKVEAEQIDIKPKKIKVPPVVFPSFKPKSEFWNFTKQRIYIDKGIQTDVRWIAYLDFVEKGLLPLMKNYGYHIQAKPIEIVHNLCRMTFACSKNQFQDIKFSNDPDCKEEDLDYFEHQLDFDTWEQFWNRWSDIYDFSNDCEYGRKIRYRMPYFIWSFVNIQLSSATTQLDDELSDSENDLLETEAPKPKQENIADDNYYSSQSKFYN